MIRAPVRAGGSLFGKYFLVLFAAVVVPLLAAGASEGWLGYRDQRAHLDALLRAEARLAAAKIQSFVDGIRDQLAWAVQLPWTEGPDERHQTDALRLLRQVPAVVSLTLVDGAGRERLYVSRISLNRMEGGVDRSADPAVAGARSAGVWYGPVTSHRESEPFMTIAVAGNRAAAGVAVAEINLKLIWDVITSIRVGESGQALVLDEPGRIIAHPDISLVLRGEDDPAAKPLQALRAAVLAQGGAATGQDTVGRTVMAAMAPVPGVDWSVLVHQPVAEAFGSIYAALWRTGGLLLGGAIFASALAYWLAGRMTKPIRLLEDGAQRIGAGQFDHRIDITTGDELARLAARFNQMAGELAVSQERSERINRLKRFLAPQVAELIERAGDGSVLDSQRVQVAVVFGDLRGFTAFSARAEPETIMGVLGEYYEALGAVVARHGGTLTNFSGDGLMVLINAPVPCPDPAWRAVEMAVEMQSAAQALIGRWRARGHALGFGVGLAMGPATVGRIGSESRLDYTAVGSVVNLASRLCSSAEDGQVLIDSAAVAMVCGRMPLIALGSRALKGYDEPVAVYAIDFEKQRNL
ncbi:MAG: adenylate/guanylate cyclase domain-containing protein [Rhodospirillales bacterium]